MKNIALGIMLMLSAAGVQAAVITEEVTYKAGDTLMKGFLAYDDNIKEPRPGILVVHEWWGHNDYARRRAKMLSELGYSALAVDMYGDGKTADHPDQAKEFSSSLQTKMATDGQERFLAALGVLKRHPTVDPKRIAAIGYCFGGGTVLNMARYGVDLKGVVSFHGGLATQTPAEPGKVKAKILVCHGADDQFIPLEQIEGFKKEMEAAGVDYSFISYEGALHSFTNPDADKLAQKFGLSLAYNPTADRQSWEDMQKFLQEIFGKVE